ncbi:SDR family NAD(P)-dependent oxidoreductase [Zhongshania sp.]|uniref:SDR family NAD(P)-dependent oxidoreductase n=1 Tax=Zhongshania sp. TaxID=1971902 RepID=UPI003567336C
MPKQSIPRVAVVTGASSGIGKAAAKQLVTQGWHVIGQGRNPERSAAAAAEIHAIAGNGKFNMVQGDLSLLSDTARMANEISALTDKIHLLLNNAGGVRAEMIITSEGNEATFAGNHLGHFLLTQHLLPLLQSASKTSAKHEVRVVNVTSDGHKGCPGIDWDDLQLTKEWNTGKSYCLAKLANILFTRELAQRVQGDGIIVHAFHPGTVDSNFINHAEARMRAYIETLQFRSPADAAADLLWVAMAPENGEFTAQYFESRVAMDPAPAALDRQAATRLWQESEKLIANFI